MQIMTNQLWCAATHRCPPSPRTAIAGFSHQRLSPAGNTAYDTHQRSHHVVTRGLDLNAGAAGDPEVLPTCGGTAQLPAPKILV